MLNDLNSAVNACGPYLQIALTIGWSLVTLSALRASFRHLNGSRRTWRLIALAGVFLVAETAWPQRYAVTTTGRAILVAIGGENAIRDRRPLQAAVILIILVPVCILAFRALLRLRGPTPPQRRVLLGVAIAMAGLMLESISLHQIDAIRLIYWWIQGAGLSWGVAGALDSKRHTAIV